jgi:hypothetical protein
VKNNSAEGSQSLQDCLFTDLQPINIAFRELKRVACCSISGAVSIWCFARAKLLDTNR